MNGPVPNNTPPWLNPLTTIQQDVSAMLRDQQKKSDQLYRLNRELTAEQRNRMEQTQQQR